MNPIAEKYLRLGQSRGPLGRSVGVIRICPDRVGRFRRFEWGAIYWHPDLGASAIYSEILDTWSELGGPTGSLGYPTYDELASGHGPSRCSCFQHGRVYWSPESGAFVTDLVSDAAVSHWAVFNSSAPSHDLVVELAKALPSDFVLDYSADANFVRNQGTSDPNSFGDYGCPLHTLLHITDILKDWEHPYTPAVSWRYAEWLCKGYIHAHGGAQPDLHFVADQGVAPEGLCDTNYDTQFQWIPLGGDKYEAQWKEPSQAAKDAAPLYRVSIKPNNEMVTVSQDKAGIELIKGMLRKYGPIAAAGGGHFKTIVGYNDMTREFNILDSYCHEVDGGHNLVRVSYDAAVLNRQAGAYNLNAIAAVSNLPTPERATGKHAYSARISVDGTWRGTFTVSIGVEGKAALVVYTTRGRNIPEPPAALDPSHFLRIDVPLPDYAASYWPPGGAARWFLRVEDHDRDGATGTITEFTLARRYRHPDCLSVGKYRTETYGGTMSVLVPDPPTGPVVDPPGLWGPSQTPNPDPGVAIFYIPDQAGSGQLQPAKVPVHYSIELQEDAIQLGKAIPGRVLKSGPPLGEMQPVPSAEVTLFRLIQNACVNQPSHWQAISTVLTDAHGHFTFLVKHDIEATDYYAVGLGAEPGQLLASTDYVEVHFSPAPGGNWGGIGTGDLPKVFADLSPDPNA
jgi:hypothetical protein